MPIYPTTLLNIFAQKHLELLMNYQLNNDTGQVRGVLLGLQVVFLSGKL